MDDRPECCVVLVPVFGSVEPETERGLHALADRGYPVRFLRGSSQIDLARSTLATRAMRDGFAETLWVDADVVFDPDDVGRLRAHGLPLSAGLYMRKGPKEFAGKFRSPEATFGLGGGLLEMEYVGMGFTHVRRQVYQKIAEGLPECGGGYDGETVIPYFLPVLAETPDGREYLSEDFSFCRRAAGAGFTPTADTTIRLGHVGRYAYTWDDFAPRQRIDSLRLGVADKAADVPPDGGSDVGLMQSLAAEAERAADLHAGYRRLLGVLQGVASGAIAPERIRVDPVAEAWEVLPLAPEPADIRGRIEAAARRARAAQREYGESGEALNRLIRERDESEAPAENRLAAVLNGDCG